jgi:signal transduction histidine kinase
VLPVPASRLGLRVPGLAPWGLCCIAGLYRPAFSGLDRLPLRHCRRNRRHCRRGDQRDYWHRLSTWRLREQPVPFGVGEQGNDHLRRIRPRLFRRVIENLIGNAWEYTATREGAWIHFGSRRDGNKTVFSVEDNGVGFDMRYADRLFSPFQRLHGTEFEGTGIGLASVARMIRRHGGDYWGTGEVGKGACFYFTVSDDGDSRQTRTAARPPAGGPTEVSRLVAAAPEQPKHLQG